MGAAARLAAAQATATGDVPNGAVSTGSTRAGEKPTADTVQESVSNAARPGPFATVRGKMATSPADDMYVLAMSARAARVSLRTPVRTHAVLLPLTTACPKRSMSATRSSGPATATEPTTTRALPLPKAEKYGEGSGLSARGLVATPEPYKAAIDGRSCRTAPRRVMPDPVSKYSLPPP